MKPLAKRSDPFFKPEQGDVYVILDLGMTGVCMSSPTPPRYGSLYLVPLAISWFLADELSEQSGIKKQHWITNCPERPSHDLKYAGLQKVPARLAREGDTITFGFQIDNQTDPESILEHFKRRLLEKRNPEYKIAYQDFLCSAFSHSFTSISNTIGNPNLCLKYT